MVEEKLELGAEIAVAKLVDSGGVDMAVNGGEAGDAEAPGDGLGADPAKEFLLDGFTLGMVANSALAGVAGMACLRR
ncbi:MAG: hypothetical protein WBP79_01235 [Candidatus Acidiferrales bacterium]